LNRNTWPEGSLSGGARRDRTDDLMLAKHALSQLSYGPFQRERPERQIRDALLSRQAFEWQMVGLGRLELPTSRLSSARSNQLSYKPQAYRPKLMQTLAHRSTALQRKTRASPGAFAQTPARPRGLVREERETKAAKSRKFGLNGQLFQVIQ
jgi:hypothetical protein